MPFAAERTDADIAAAAVDRLLWNTSVPKHSVEVTVEKGWVTLSGQVDWFYQRKAVKQDVRPLLGVTGVSNRTAIKPRVDTSNLGDDITHALHRSWFFDPDTISVRAEGGKVILSGTVHLPYDRQVAAATAWSAPGATAVGNDITVA